MAGTAANLGALLLSRRVSAVGAGTGSDKVTVALTGLPPLTLARLKLMAVGTGCGGAAELAVMVMGADVALPPTLSVTFKVAV